MFDELGGFSNTTSNAENDANGNGWLASGGLDRTVKVRHAFVDDVLD